MKPALLTLFTSDYTIIATCHGFINQSAHVNKNLSCDQVHVRFIGETKSVLCMEEQV